MAGIESCSVLTGTMDGALASLYRGGRKLGGESNDLIPKLLNGNIRPEGCKTHALCSGSLEHNHGPDSN